MIILLLMMSIIIGVMLYFVVKKSSEAIILYKDNIRTFLNFNLKYIYILAVTASLLILISYYKFGFSMLFIKAVIFDCILIVVSFIDLIHNIIPNKLLLIAFILGIVLVFIWNITLLDALLGMLAGGIILFIMGLVPKSIGGGDIKLMFVLGLFLGLRRVMYSLMFSFILAAIISLILLVSRIKGLKEHIPLGPFLAIGSFAAFHFYT
ncbi:MAG: A24 family peptidase [Bacillota bacterium]|nr:A24 family peptidase [Bacillota bacterium]